MAHAEKALRNAREAEARAELAMLNVNALIPRERLEQAVGKDAVALFRARRAETLRPTSQPDDPPVETPTSTESHPVDSLSTRRLLAIHHQLMLRTGQFQALNHIADDERKRLAQNSPIDDVQRTNTAQQTIEIEAPSEIILEDTVGPPETTGLESD